MNSQTGFWFPSMKVGEISRALEEWGLRVSDDQVQRPTGDTVQAIYILFVQLATGITPDSLEEPVNRALASIEEYTELYQNSLNLNLVLLHVQRIAHAARVQDITIRDLVTPEPERTRNILSAIINFIKFAEERGTFLKNLREQSTSALEERDAMIQQVTELREKVAEIKQRRKIDESRVLELREENEKLRSDLPALEKDKLERRRETDAMKKEREELARNKENLLKDISLVDSQISATRKRIVQSPERLKKHISAMTIQAREEREVLITAENKSKELKIKLDALAVYEQDMKKLIEDLGLIKIEHEQVEETRRKLAQIEEELDRKGILSEQLAGKLDRATRQKEIAENKLQRATQQAEDRRARAQDELAKLQRDYNEMAEERKENDRMVDETKAQAAELERKMREHARKNEAEINELLNEYWRLRLQIDVYMETLAAKLSIELE